MDKYNVPRQRDTCPVCGEPTYEVGINIVCLECQLGDTPSRQKLPKNKNKTSDRTDKCEN